MRKIEDIAYGKLPEQMLNLYLPDSGEFDVIVWFHGGGLEAGNRSMPDFANDLTAKGVALVSVEYRMYPTAVFPQYLLDAALAVNFVQKHISEYGCVKGLYVSGASAGAYITMMLCVNPAYLRNAGVDPASIAGFISDSAQVTTHFNVLRERGLDSRAERIDEAAPLWYVSEDLKFTRLLMISYADDVPCRPEQNKLMYRAIKRLLPDANAEYVELPGGHCSGSTRRNEKGTYDYADAVLRFLGIA